jgi:N-acetylmuramoyl-L-alanine amidase
MKKKLLTAIASLACSAALILPASAAAKTVPVQVDGGTLACTAYLSGGVTYVPLRTLLDALGGWELHWDSGAQEAVGSRGSNTLTADPGHDVITFDGDAYSGSVWVEQGRTYVPLRTVATVCGASVSWDARMGGAAVTTATDNTGTYSASDLYWLSRIISAESQGESMAGQIAVGNVVLNRVASSTFPNTIQGVIFDKQDGVQFEPVSLGTVYDTPTAQSITAAKAALNGQSVVGKCLYFYAPALSQGTWIRANRAYYTTIGCHRFYL